uniref:histone deacetylase n=1 Tax=Chromera velia CCMP2878 TaxID=1169474 RepID=A0A0G4HFI9_9ALVE|eukprot:Cvel_27082.t1-p1 / transcript=Cvel_27082.t1 / gene=Cvel_27082 / organism=Chromera_velia_CCMP2878 / gene_product=Histone deacetylase 1, putative / transcript_product=Histone deacetylase 1, putative / location=Cvel_scaffold3317:3529-9756(-) / protein_length=550 / sequence_SO=supercontig / SO=protein_coding / is_pseudo=false
MKPQRIRATHSLILSYDLYRHLETFCPQKADLHQLSTFHDSDYVDFLSKTVPSNVHEFAKQAQRFGVGPGTDCPVFDGVFDFQRTCAGASIEAAQRLNHGRAEIAVNWAGGLHHAKKSEAAGFCYFNDIVLCILELLKHHQRVLYIDIDIHHGDGVEEAFFTSNRVMTVSFHKHGDYFPGTGDLGDIGAYGGKFHTVNVPLKDGVDDNMFVGLFKNIMERVMERFRPGAVVLQCGADSLTGDRLGVFNLTLKGHAACVRYIQQFCVPLVVLGGGGYTLKNVARCWAFETGVILNHEAWMPNEIPNGSCFESFGPDYKLHLTASSSMQNQNTADDILRLQTEVLKNLKQVEVAPAVPFFHTPGDFFAEDPLEDDEKGEAKRQSNGKRLLELGVPPDFGMAPSRQRLSDEEEDDAEGLGDMAEFAGVPHFERGQRDKGKDTDVLGLCVALGVGDPFRHAEAGDGEGAEGAKRKGGKETEQRSEGKPEEGVKDEREPGDSPNGTETEHRNGVDPTSRPNEMPAPDDAEDVEMEGTGKEVERDARPSKDVIMLD